jgi:transposase
MFIECVKNNGTKYLRLATGQRITDSNGVRTIRKKVEFNIGPLSKYDDGKPDYLKRLRDSFKNGNPLIESLLPFTNVTDPAKEKYSFALSEGDPFCVGHPKLYSHILIERILEELGLISAIASYKTQTKIEYDIVGFLRLLIYGRILKPESKIATSRQNDLYYDSIVDSGSFYEYNIYDSLNFVYEYKKQIINRINTKLIEKQERNTDVIFYDVTNFFFETESADEDITDDDDTIIEKGIRKFGVSKENRNQPIVQMGLFMDQNGYPISIEIFPGNTLDHLTVHKALSNNIDNVINSRYIFIADRGICNFDNAIHLESLNKGYIMSKSIKKSDKQEKEWILNQNDYIELNPTFKYKSKVITKKIILTTGEKRTITYKSTVYWSKKFYDRELYENKSFLDFIERLQSSPTSFKVYKNYSRTLKKFLKKDLENVDTGEIIDSTKLKALLDMDKVNAYKELFGYYQIITSELTMDDLEVINKYHGLTQIENQFRIMKSDLETRPMFVRRREHIEAHLIICMISLIVLRVIQKRILDSKVMKPEKKKNGEALSWEVGLSSLRIQEALNSWTVDKLPDDLFRFNNLDNNDLKLILKAYSIDIPTKLFRRLELKHIKRNIKIFD